jgi:hypothetical protein
MCCAHNQIPALAASQNCQQNQDESCHFLSHNLTWLNVVSALSPGHVSVTLSLEKSSHAHSHSIQIFTQNRFDTRLCENILTTVFVHAQQNPMQYLHWTRSMNVGAIVQATSQLNEFQDQGAMLRREIQD